MISKRRRSMRSRGATEEVVWCQCREREPKQQRASLARSFFSPRQSAHQTTPRPVHPPSPTQVNCAAELCCGPRTVLEQSKWHSQPCVARPSLPFHPAQQFLACFSPSPPSHSIHPFLSDPQYSVPPKLHLLHHLSSTHLLRFFRPSLSSPSLLPLHRSHHRLVLRFRDKQSLFHQEPHTCAITLWALKGCPCSSLFLSVLPSLPSNHTSSTRLYRRHVL